MFAEVGVQLIKISVVVVFFSPTKSFGKIFGGSLNHGERSKIKSVG